MKKRFTDDEIKLANETDILILAQSRGYEIKKISGKSYKITDYGGLQENQFVPGTSRIINSKECASCIMIF